MLNLDPIENTGGFLSVNSNFASYCPGPGNCTHWGSLFFNLPVIEYAGADLMGPVTLDPRII